MPSPDRELTVPELAKKAYLRANQRKELEQSTTDLRERLANPALIELSGGDPETLEQQYQREMDMLEQGTPPRYDTQSMNRLARLRKHLEEKFTHSLPTFSQMERAIPSNIDFHTAWEKQHQQDVLAWKTCLQILDPDESDGSPNFLSIARLRSDTVKGDPRKYVQNFDFIKWEETLEDELSRDLDDAAYYRFLELKIADWTKPSILKELEWTSKMYEFAMERLRGAAATPTLQDGAAVDTLSQEEGTTATEEDAQFEVEEELDEQWPKAAIKRLGMTIRAFTDRLGLVQPRFYQYARDNSWPETWRQKVEETLLQLQHEQFEKLRATEPGHAPEPGARIRVEPVVQEWVIDEDDTDDEPTYRKD
jgi:hypothetical protein